MSMTAEELEDANVGLLANDRAIKKKKARKRQLLFFDAPCSELETQAELVPSSAQECEQVTKVSSKEVKILVNPKGAPETVEELQQMQRGLHEWLYDKQISPEERMARLTERFSNMNVQLSRVVDTMGRQSSILSKASIGWGELNIIAKAGIILGLTVVLVGGGAAGFMANILWIPAVCGVTGLLSLTSTALLSEHYACTQEMLNQIKQGFLDLACFLQNMTLSLEEIRVGFEQELTKLNQENVNFKVNNTALTEQVATLNHSVSDLMQTRKILDASVAELSLQCAKFKAHSAEQLQANKVLCELQLEQERVNRELQGQLKLLEGNNEFLCQQMSDAGEKIKALNQAITRLTSVSIKDEESRQQFLNELQKTVHSRDEHLSCLASGLEATEEKLGKALQELGQARQEYHLLHQKHQDLLDEHRNIVAELRGLLVYQKEQTVNQQQALLSRHGFHPAHKQPPEICDALGESLCDDLLHA